jgi:hypothetical protein
MSGFAVPIKTRVKANEFITCTPKPDKITAAQLRWNQEPVLSADSNGETTLQMIRRDTATIIQVKLSP